MFLKNISGQYLFFDLVSVISGFSVTGFSGQISGTKIIDSNPQAVLSGNIIETSGGTYRANLFDFDVNGNNIFYFFTASGCIPRSYMVITIDATSGHLWPASGVPTLTYSGQLSGQPIAGLSGQIYTASGIWSASGETVIVPVSTLSGLFPASGIWPASGAFTVTNIASGSTYLASGQAVALLSGQSVLVYSGQLSGQPIAGLSGRIFTASGMWMASGETVVVPVSTLSGVFNASGIWPASGAFTVTSIQSGQVYLASGTQVLVYSGQLSGQPIAGLSGFIYTASGIWHASGETVVVPVATLSGIFPSSGIWPASGAFTVTTVQSGSVYLASGQAVSLNSGQSVLVYSGQLSGQPIAGLSGFIYPASGVNTVVNLTSGQIYIASGTQVVTAVNLDKSGYTVGSLVSGILSGQQVTLTSGQSYTASGLWPASGAFTVAIISSGSVYLASGQAVALLSGQSVLVYSGQLSGQPIAGLSGFIYTASGIWSASGETVVVPGATLSGLFTASGLWPASGAFTVTTIASGSIYLASGQATALLSGQSVLVYSGQLSGQPIAGLSGFIYTASGIWHASGETVVVPVTTLSGIFTASGIWPASGAFTVTTIQSGSVYLASGQAVALLSGQSVLVYSGQLSGQPIAGLSGFIYPASGIFTVTSIASGQVYLASGQSVALLSGQSVLIYSGQLSGQPIAGLSGFIYPASGIFTVTSIASGQVYLASGQAVSLLSGQSVLVYSGQLSGQPIAGLSGQIYPASGAFTVTTIQSGQVYLASGQATALLSGQSVLIYSGQLSGQPIAGLSGFIYPASGVFTVTSIASGQVFLASGQAVALLSGQSVLVYSGQLSGQPIAGLSGLIYPVSGVFTVTSIASGQVFLASGQAVALLSGQSVLVYSGQLSGQPIAGLSGQIYPASGIFTVTSIASGQVFLASGQAVSLLSGQSVLVYSGQLSGQPIAGLSGQNYPASGVFTVTSIASGQVYLASGQAVSLLSGQSVLVYSGQLSGQPIAGLSGQIYSASGVFTVTSIASGQVYLASGQAVSLLSGQSVLVYSGQLSGQPIAGLSGQIYTASGMWPASGAFTVTTIQSGQVFLASGQATLVASGQLSGQPIAGLSGFIYPASGIFTVTSIASGQVYLASGQSVALLSGQSVLIYSGQLSGQPIAGLSGQIYPASGVFTVTSIASGQVYLASGQAVALLSGQSVLVYSGQLSGQPIAGLSGQIYPASGVFTVTSIQSGSVYLASGQIILIASGQLSGQPIAGLSGLIYPASGVFTVTSIASGQVYLASGQAVSLLSGQSVLVYSGQLSGQPIAGLSGFIYPASGVNTTLALQSGQVYIASGTPVVTAINQDKSGYSIQFVASGILSGQIVSLLSGQIYPASGIYTVIPPASLSGIAVIVPGASLSGQLYLASGSIFTTTFASGVLTVAIPYDILTVDMSGVTGEALHSVVNAMRKLICKWDTLATSGFVTIYKEDAQTIAYQQAQTPQSGAELIVTLGGP